MRNKDTKDEMRNKGTKEKRVEKFRKKRFWPAIVVFIGVTFFSVSMVMAFVAFFTTYVGATKISRMHEEAVYAGASFDRLMESGMTAKEAGEELQVLLNGDTELYLLDSGRNMIMSTGTSRPRFDVSVDFSLGGNEVVLVDSVEESLAAYNDESLMNIIMDLAFKGVYGKSEFSRRDAGWLQEGIFEQKFWMQSPIKQPNYFLYTRQELKIQRQDIFYIGMLGTFALFAFLVPSAFLFINTIRAIVVQRRMANLMYLDIVTGGRNWIYFQDMAGKIVTRHRNRRKTYAVVELHMERYHNYCACYGVSAGEELLESMDGFLEARTDKGELHARYEGADFALLFCCKGESEQECREKILRRVRSLLAELTGLRPEQKLHFHAGICLICPNLTESGRHYADRKNVDIREMYSCANTARLETNCMLEQRFAFFEPKMQEKQLWSRSVVENVEAALHQEVFQVYLQPKYSPSDKKIVGAEALARWVNEAGEVIQPDRFISIMEENGLITKLDDYMISHVAKLLSEWTIQGKKVMPISINLSKAHLSQEGLAEHICRLVDAYGPRHELIELEVKEGAFFEEKDILTETVKRLKDYGFGVSLDDFGTGYSSLNSLKDMQLDAVKLDTGFFRGESDSRRGELIVREVIRMVRGLDMRVVAEGVEKEEQVDFLTESGCDMIQGFYFARPMPVCEFEKKVEMDG